MSVEATISPKGVKTRLIGAGVLFVGALNSLLAWRGGFDGGVFAGALMALGLTLLCIGTIRGATRGATRGTIRGTGRATIRGTDRATGNRDNQRRSVT